MKNNDLFIITFYKIINFFVPYTIQIYIIFICVFNIFKCFIFYFNFNFTQYS